MPTNRKKLNLLDVFASVAVGINIPFSANVGITPNYTTQEALKNNIINYVLTNENERLMKSSFGGNLRNTVFQVQTEDELEAVGDNLKYGLEREFPVIKVTDISFKPNPDENSLNFFITYALSTGTTDSVAITL